MGAIDVAVFAFDMDEQLVLVNPAGERLLGQPARDAARARTRRSCASRAASTARRRGCSTARSAPRADASSCGASTFRRDGKPHQLLVFADLSRALREEEQQAWQRIVRVLSHEINNSLTPIKSIAHSIKRMISRVPDIPRAAEIQDGLNLIETRSGALGRFLRAVRAARAAAEAAAEEPSRCCRSRTASRSSRTACRSSVHGADDVAINADPDQLEQLLINIVRNAVDATLETGGQVWIDWKQVDGALQITVEDEGPGLPDTSNLFVPFFTTKPAGSGIGLALSAGRSPKRTAARSRWRTGPRRRGCRAVLRLPM